MKDNKLIAEFMGFELQNNPNERWFNQWFTKETLNKPYHSRIEILHFDTDWNWLMEVVEKCLIGEAETNRPDLISKIYVGLTNVNKIETYKACVEFIKLQNN